jgi:uncharacterized DUF497 family protein
VIILVPESKRLINLDRHGIDLAEFEGGFSWEHYLVLPAHPSRTGREREMFVGTLHGRIVACIVSPLGTEAMAIISIRVADAKERAAYDAQA